MIEYNLRDVYITDHKPTVRKLNTLNSSDDEKFFQYTQDLKEYNSQISTFAQARASPTEKYERGSIMQLIADPFAGSQRLANGALFYEVIDKELDPSINDEERLRKHYDILKQNIESPSEYTEEELDQIRLQNLTELEDLAPQTVDDFEAFLDKELSVFKNGKKYDYVEDIHEAFSETLAKSEAQQIFDTIPDNVFWDIKTPQHDLDEIKLNPYNPFRKYPFESFFDFRAYDEYMNRRKLKNNLRDSISTYRRY